MALRSSISRAPSGGNALATPVIGTVPSPRLAAAAPVIAASLPREWDIPISLRPLFVSFEPSRLPAPHLELQLALARPLTAVFQSLFTHLQ